MQMIKISFKRVVLTAGVVTGLASIWPAYILGIAFGLWQPVTRPAGVARRAHYVSSIEDGTWFDCSVDSVRNVNRCRAWDFTGKLIADGDFRLEGEDRAATAAELKPSSVTSSGGHAYMIFLFGRAGARSRVLVPVDQRHPHAIGCRWESAENILKCD